MFLTEKVSFSDLAADDLKIFLSQSSSAGTRIVEENVAKIPELSKTIYVGFFGLYQKIMTREFSFTFL